MTVGERIIFKGLVLEFLVKLIQGNVYLSINYGNIANPNKFEINNIEYHIFPIPCAGPEYNDNYDISINNCNISFIIIDVSENFAQSFFIKLIGDIIFHGINIIFILFNKIDKVDFDESLKKNLKMI